MAGGVSARCRYVLILGDASYDAHVHPGADAARRLQRCRRAEAPKPSRSIIPPPCRVGVWTPQAHPERAVLAHEISEQ
eukprot:3888041-Rhodomonas_salina.1